MATGDDPHRSLERLVALGQSPEVNIRPVLLRVLVDLFVRKPHHSPADLAQFEEITQRLLDEADEETRLIVAGKLARHPAMPQALVDRFLAEQGQIAASVLEHAPVAPERLAAAAAWGTPDMALAVAHRPDLDAQLVRTVAERPEREVLLALLRNHAAPVDRSLFQYLVRRAREDEDLCRAVLGRPDAPPADLAPLFMLATRDQRASILLALRRDDLGPETLRPRLTEAQQAALLRVERSLLFPDTDSFDVALAAALGLAATEVWRIIDDPRGEPLAVALAAIGASAGLAARVFILSGPAIGHSVMAVRSLTLMVEDLGMRTAARLVAAMTGTAGRSARPATARAEVGARRRNDGWGRPAAGTPSQADPDEQGLLQRRLLAGRNC